jgi:phosphoribosylformimino-5-aminoimidazole carboxamide ribotide isomerase
MTPFTIFPAIDLRAGAVVRLSQGDPARQTVYSADPAQTARRWQAAGASWVHVVNLDGAFAAGGGVADANLRALEAIAGTGLRVQFGGGVRDDLSLRCAFDLGAARVVLGTAALENPALVDTALRAFGVEGVAVGIDARDGLVRVRGWAAETAVPAAELGQRLAGQGVVWCVFTDISRDGIGAGVNLPATVALAQATGLRVIASGGVAGPGDVRAVRAAGLPGVVIGRALYEGQVDLGALLGEAA